MGSFVKFLFLAYLSTSTAAPSGNIGVRWLFPENRLYAFDLKSNISTGSVLPAEGASQHTLQARLSVQVFNETRLKLRLDDVKTALYNTNSHPQSNSQGSQSLPLDARILTKPWEAHYLLESGVLYAVQLADDEPLWSSNIKRALAVSLQLSRVNATDVYKKSYTVVEPCLHDTCQAVYSGVDTKTVRKSHGIPASTRGYGRNVWFSVRPDVCNKDIKQPFIGNAERVYQLDDRGLYSMDLRSSLEYHSHNHLLAVVTEMSLYRVEIKLHEMGSGPAMNSTYHFYYSHSYKDPTSGRRPASQQELVARTRQLLTRVSENIDRDNVVRDANKIHNLDVIELHKVMSQLDADSLKVLNNELHVGTSYLNETNKNVFFEVLPHVRSADSARLVKYLVVEFADQKFEDATALSLIRKLPFNVAEYSQSLLLQMEDLLNLTPEVSQDIRHASILSFATLAFHTYINGGCSADEFEEYVKKYFGMYKDCPSYADRLVWLQGLANLQVGSVSSYLWPVIQDQKVSRHERFLAILATMPLAPFTPETTNSLYWPILTDPNEHIQLRISALMMLLFGEQSPSRVLSLHQYVSSCEDNHLKRFWYTTVRSLEKSSFSCFHPLAKLTSYVSKLVRTPDPRYWATGNYIVDTSDDDRDSAAMGQLWSIAEPMTGHPAVVYLTVNTNQAGLLTNQIAVMVKAEGVTANFLSKLMSLSSGDARLDTLSDLLRRMKVETKTPERVHIEVLVSIQDKTVYAVHFNQTTFDKWTGSDMINTMKSFLMMSDSHVNQQLIQYPLQTDINLPTELGTPITLQTTWSSFFSVRGTMTSPSNGEQLVRKNDAHFRYHGTAVTTLSSYGPLLGSEHSVTIQQSLVAHLPLKLDLTFYTLKKILDLKWLNEDQTGGVAMHSRSQVSLSLGYGRDLTQFCPNCQDTYTVRVQGASSDQGDPSGVFFDCDRPMTGVELLEKLLDSNKANYDFFSSLRPSLIVVHGLYLLSVPPSGACGVVVPSRFPLHLKKGTSLGLSAQVVEFEAGSEEHVKLNVYHQLTWKETGSFGGTLLNINGTTFLENTDEKLRVAIKLTGFHPEAVNYNKRYWQICIEEQDIYRVPGDRDISIYPSPFQGELKVAFDATAYPSPKSCPDYGSIFHLKYSGDPVVNYTSQEVNRYFDVTLYGKNLPNMTYLSELGFGHVTAMGQILERVTANPFNVTASVNEWDGIADVTIDHGPKWQFRTDNFNWLLDYWSNTQLMKKFGIYRECRLQERTVNMLSGVVEQLQSPTCSESLALADCSAKPRFALLRVRGGGYKFYTGGNYVTITPMFAGKPTVTVNGYYVDYSRGYKYPQDEKFYDFKISNAAGAVRVSSRLSGVQLFYRMYETVILVPDTYMSVVCGSCASSSHQYNLCP